MRNRVLVICAVAFAACATAERPPTTYADGPMVRPLARAPAFDPAFDSPNPFERPPAREKIQPQPKPERVLPETPQTRREPGLWSATQPTAGGPSIPKILTIPLELPAPVVSARFLNTVDDCADAINRVFGADYPLISSTTRITPKERRCLVAALFFECSRRSARGQADWFQEVSGAVPNLADAKVLRNVRDQEDAALALHQEWCRGKDADTATVRSIMSDFTAAVIQQARHK